MVVQINRGQASKARQDTRCWAVERRARTRHLIELGGLVQKAGLAALLDDDRATILGALLDSVERLTEGNGLPEAESAGIKAIWRKRGLRAFDGETEEYIRSE